MVNNVQYKHKIYTALTGQESVLLNAVAPLLLFSTNDLKHTTGWTTSKIHNTLKRLKTNGLVIAIKRDSFVLAEKIPEHIFALAVHAAAPAYVSFWTAASYYGFTEQQLQTVQVVSTKQYQPMIIGTHRIEVCTYKPDRFYGYQQREGFAIAEPEKLLVDILYKPEKAGGIAECKKILTACWNSLDKKIVLLYLARFENRSLYARLGYLLENIDPVFSTTLKSHCPDTVVLLNPQKVKTNTYNPTWRLNINDQ